MAKPLLECERGYKEASVDMCEYLSEGESLEVSRWLEVAWSEQAVEETTANQADQTPSTQWVYEPSTPVDSNGDK